MKKILLAFLTLAAFTACDNEPVGSDIIGGENPGMADSDLISYNLILNTTTPILGNLTVDTKFVFGPENTAQSALITSSILGETITESVIYNRNASGLITGYTSSSQGMTTNQTTVTYTDDKITKIVYDFIGDDEDDYTYNFTYEGNTIKRTQPESNFVTVFSFDANERLVKKETFEDQTSILKEIVTYNAEGNCIASLTTGEIESTQSFDYDTKVNPLKLAFSDQYLLTYLNDDYEDNIGASLAQFYSTNNWKQITADEGTTNFNLTYDEIGRITLRDSSYDVGDQAGLDVTEFFEFAN